MEKIPENVVRPILHFHQVLRIGELETGP